MGRSASQAQIAFRVTFVLKGHLKNARIAYIRAAVLLARVRDEKLWQAIDHRDIEEYAAQRLGLQRAALYRYLQIYNWLREFHPGWLTRRPKGFIPELSDVSALIWIEHRLRNLHLTPSLRAELERLHKKALAGALTEKEFRELRSRGRRVVTPMRALLNRLRSLRRFAARVPNAPAAALTGLDGAIRETERVLRAALHVARMKGIRVVPKKPAKARRSGL